MSVRKLTTSLLTTLAVFAGGHSVSAQNNNYLTPGDPFSMEQNVNWFEPVYDADILDVKPKKRANTGWFATIDKLALYGTRPDLEDDLLTGQDDQRSSHKLDEGSGTRYEFGFMLEEKDQGMLFTAMDFDVGEYDTFQLQRINRLNDENLTGDPNFPAPPFGVDALVNEDGNNFGFNTRFYDVGRTLNVADVQSYELMKTWRLEPYHYGGILEPMIGLRYVKLKDYNAEFLYRRTFDAQVGIASGEYFFPGSNASDISIDGADAIEQYDTFEHITDNDIISGQVGFRYFKWAGRMRYSGEARVFTGIAFQTSEQFTSRETTVYDGFDIGSDTTTHAFSETNSTILENEEFMIGFDVRGELGYQLTKMIQIRGGLQLINLATGVWRGGPIESPGLIDGGDRDQNFLAFGGTFGLELNR